VEKGKDVKEAKRLCNVPSKNESSLRKRKNNKHTRQENIELEIGIGREYFREITFLLPMFCIFGWNSLCLVRLMCFPMN